MSENRRLLVDVSRLNETSRNIKLNISEKHYLSRVLRLKKGDQVSIVDGLGNYWEATFENSDYIYLNTSYEEPLFTSPKSSPLVCLAIVIPKRGFDELIRMTTEIGVDIIQPLISDRCNIQIRKNKDRWNDIIRESVELSERLWAPDLLEITKYSDWLETIKCKNNSLFALANTRNRDYPNLTSWLHKSYSSHEKLWIIIGPEGGWSSSEIKHSLQYSLQFIQLGESILRTSTASVASINEIVSWRRLN